MSVGWLGRCWGRIVRCSATSTRPDPHRLPLGRGADLPATAPLRLPTFADHRQIFLPATGHKSLSVNRLLRIVECPAAAGTPRSRPIDELALIPADGTDAAIVNLWRQDCRRLRRPTDEARYRFRRLGRP
jgi:hypothetical protein